MSNITINSLPTASTIDGSLDILPIYTASSAATQGITRNVLLNLTSGPVGLTDSQTLTNKILTAPTISSPVLSGTITGTYTIGGTPTFPSSVVTLTGSQTLTNKILTSPTINAPTITNATLSADTITGFSSSLTGTIYGMSVAAGILASAALSNAVNTAALQSSAVTTAKINNAAVTADKLGTGATTGTVATSQTTASTSYTDLATSGPAVTVTIGANGLALVIVSADALNNTANSRSLMAFAISGANTAAASDTQALITTVSAGGGDYRQSVVTLVTGLVAGSTTFTAKYRVSGNTGTFQDRNIAVIPL